MTPRTDKIRRHLKTHSNRRTHIHSHSASPFSEAALLSGGGGAQRHEQSQAHGSAVPGRGPQQAQVREREGGNHSGTLTPHSSDATAQVTAWGWQDSARDLVFRNWGTSFHLRGCPHSRVVRGRVKCRGQRASVQDTGNIQHEQPDDHIGDTSIQDCHCRKGCETETGGTGINPRFSIYRYKNKHEYVIHRHLCTCTCIRKCTRVHLYTHAHTFCSSVHREGVGALTPQRQPSWCPNSASEYQLS